MIKPQHFLLFSFLICYLSGSAQTIQTPVFGWDTTGLFHQQVLLKEQNQQQQLDAALTRLNQPKKTYLTNGGAVEAKFVSPTGQIVFVQTDNNLDAAKTIGTNKAWPGGGLGFSLTGQNMTNRLAVWDGGGVLVGHQEFQGRATQTDAASPTIEHATHVAGTMTAAGVNANAKGMSYQAPIKCFDWTNDQSEMSSAANLGLLISNHSYGYIEGWYYNSGQSRYEWYGDLTISGTTDYKYGFYDDQSAGFDQIAVNYPNYLPFIAAGNDRGSPGSIPSTYYVRNTSGSWVLGSTSNPPSAVGPYDCVGGGAATAKNTITIGAVSAIPAGYSGPTAVVMSSFSGWGPVDDGRIKPDVVADGVSVYSSTNTSTTSYATLSGTSMATPNASGSALLIQQQYNNFKGGFMRAATLKGLIIHTADEAGQNPGPDYSFGWGLMNTGKAVQMIADSLTSSLRELTLNNGNTYNTTFYSDGINPVKVTICWTDPAGTPVAPALNPTNKMLVNDLDLRVKRNSDNTTYLPYVLNRATPTAAATTGDNTTDNVEQVYLATPIAGTYTITVTHKNTLSGSAQNFSMLLSGITPKPAAGFSVANRTACINSAVTFTDISSGALSRKWYFYGGNPSTSTAVSPSVTYSAPGVYPVALKISGGQGSDSIYKKDFLVVGGVGLPFTETFENNSSTRSSWTIQDVTNDSTWRLFAVAGNTPGNLAMGMNNYDYPGNFTIDRLISPTLDFKGYTNLSMNFQHAYTRYDNTSSDSLFVFISTNCGATYTKLAAYGENGTGNFATAPDKTSYASLNAFVPTKAADWCGGGIGPNCFSINLNAYAGSSNVKIKFEQEGFGGNNLFIDNVNVTGTGSAPISNFYSFKNVVCANEQVQFMDSSRNRPSEWYWYVNGAAVSTEQNPILKFAAPGTYRIALAVKNTYGRDSVSKTAYITVSTPPATPTITSTKGEALCNGDSAVISTTLSSSFLWFKDSTVAPITSSSFVQKDNAKVFLRVYDANGCYAQSNLLNMQTGTIPAKPTLSSSITGNTFCEGVVFVLTSSANVSNQWLLNGQLIPGQTAKTFSYADSGTFTVRAGLSPCFASSDPIRYDKLKVPATTNISGRTWVAKGDSTNYSVFATPGSTFNWGVTNGTIATGAGTANVKVRFNTTGTQGLLSVQETGSNGCLGLTKTFTVSLVNTGLNQNSPIRNLNIFPNPTSDQLSLEVDLINAGTVKATIFNLVGQEVMSYEWLNQSGSIHKDISVQHLPAGYYLLRVESGNKQIAKSFIKN